MARAALGACDLCHHEAVMKEDAFDVAVPVRAFADGRHSRRHHRRIRPAEWVRANRASEPDGRAMALSYNDLLLLFLGLFLRGQIATLGRIHVSCQN